ncbi:hypothetical protein QYG89_15320 [Bacillus sp. B190/17]|uniref:YfjL-like N-terminal domain-containing protein n=1 Tax=Bacillus lumedeiriae TaxID=3058829 RepID=A0ABW8IBY0_9BACI
MTKNKKRLVIFMSFMILVAVVLWVLSALFGLPWKEKAIADKVEKHLEKKYEKDFELKESYFSFKDGTYGGIFYPEEDPSMEFHAGEGYAEYKYVDMYPEVLWAHQLQEEIDPEVRKVFPNVKSVHVSYVSYQSLDKVKGPDIPRYDEADAALFPNIELEETFTNSKEQWSAMAGLIHSVQSRTAASEVSFNFIEKETNTEAFVLCPPKSTAVITNAQQAQKHCSMRRYDLETSSLVE